MLHLTNNIIILQKKLWACIKSILFAVYSHRYSELFCAHIILINILITMNSLSSCKRLNMFYVPLTCYTRWWWGCWWWRWYKCFFIFSICSDRLSLRIMFIQIEYKKSAIVFWIENGNKYGKLIVTFTWYISLTMNIFSFFLWLMIFLCSIHCLNHQDSLFPLFCIICYHSLAQSFSFCEYKTR